VENEYRSFQQHCATAHATNSPVAVLSNIFGDQIVSGTLWPSSSLNMNHCEYYLWGGLKETRIRTIHTHTHTHTHTNTHTHTHKHTHKHTRTKARTNKHPQTGRMITDTAVWAASRQEISLPGVNMQATSKSCSHTRRLLQYRLLEWVVCGVSTFGWAFRRRHPSTYFLAVKLSYYLRIKCQDPRIYIVAW
jgi:hypothetical protein